MKSERRHELQHNTLADWLVNASETIKPYQNQILAAVTLIVVAIAGYALWSHITTTSTTESWNQFQTAFASNDPTMLTRVNESYRKTTAGEMAALVAADLRFQKGCEQLFVRKSVGQDELNKAIEAYEKVLQESKTQFVLEGATLGLARAFEARGDKESLQKATEYYDEVVRSGPTGAAPLSQTNV